MGLPEKKNDSLFSLVQLSHQVQQMLAENYGEVYPETEKMLAELTEKLPNKADAIKFVVDDLNSQAALWESRAQDLLKIAKAFNKYSEKLEDSIQVACVQLGVTELEGNEYTWRLVKSQPSVIIDDPAAIPSGHKEIVQTTSIKKKSILEDLKSGLPVPGAHLELKQHIRCYVNTKGGKK